MPSLLGTLVKFFLNRDHSPIELSDKVSSSFTIFVPLVFLNFGFRLTGHFYSFSSISETLIEGLLDFRSS